MSKRYWLLALIAIAFCITSEKTLSMETDDKLAQNSETENQIVFASDSEIDCCDCCCTANDSSCDVTCSSACYQPVVYASAEALFLRRDNSSVDQPIVLDSGTTQTLISAGDLNFDTEAGVRFCLGRQLNDHLALEAGYFGLHEWSATATAVGSNNLRIPGDLALATLDYFDADQMQVDYNSEIHSAEISLVKQHEQLHILCGFRYFEFDDDLNINTYEGGTNTTSDYNIRARNSLYGAQVGAKFLQSIRRAEFRAVGKVGIYGTDSRQSTVVGDFDNQFTLRNVHASEADAAFVGEIGLNLAMPVRNSLRIVAGYNLLWVEGIALAPDQLDFTDTPTSSQFVNTDGGVFFYGANIGLEGIW